MKSFFPFKTVRRGQFEFMKDLQAAILNSTGFIAHAPTGIGKTVASLVPVLKAASAEKKKIFFLTSRHTQHKIALDTLRMITKKKKIKACDIIGRKWMCLQPGIDNLKSNEFSEYCKSVRESKSCEFYQKTIAKNKLTANALQAAEVLSSSIWNTEKLIGSCRDDKLCPYEIAVALAEDADVIVCDYYYIFNQSINHLIMQKAGLKLEDCYVIVDEAHNLPSRLMELGSAKLSDIMLQRAGREAEKFGYGESAKIIKGIRNILREMMTEERVVAKQELVRRMSSEIEITQLVSDFEHIADEVREKQKSSYIGSVAGFLSEWWRRPERGFARIINPKSATLFNYCLDPSIISKEIFERAAHVTLMSGTLVPTAMYRDILGMERAVEKSYKSPFPPLNRLNMIVPKTTTKYEARSDAMYRQIAIECADMVNEVPGNSIIFFPSYHIKDMVYPYFMTLSKKTIMSESPDMTTSEKEETIDKFRSYSKTGAVILGVVSGSFYEGIDLPGDLLKCVIVVGLPLQQPDLRTKELISYYDEKFGKGWDYGYVFPAFNKALQSAGRCIRSEDDRGIVVFLDERYLWPRYRRCFPSDMQIRISKHPSADIASFFSKIDL